MGSDFDTRFFDEVSLFFGSIISNSGKMKWRSRRVNAVLGDDILMFARTDAGDL